LPHRSGQRVEHGLEIERGPEGLRFFFQPHGDKGTDGAAADRDEAIVLVVCGHREGRPFFRQRIERLREHRRVGAGETGIEQFFGIAVDARTRPVAAPHDHGFTAGADQCVARAHGGPRAGLGLAEHTPKPPRVPALGKRPEARSQRQADGAEGQRRGHSCQGIAAQVGRSGREWGCPE
jgi:hypothetical protein